MNIEYIGESENKLHVEILIDGTFITIPKKLKAFSCIEDLHTDCDNLIFALSHQEDILPFINKYGGICAYKMINSLAPDLFLSYFKNIAEQKLQAREMIYPRKIIKAYKLNNAIDKNPNDPVIAMLEKYASKAFELYPQSNSKELVRDDCWNLFYTDSRSLRHTCIDFTFFGTGELHFEILQYFRESFYLLNPSALHRLNRDLRTAFGIIGCKHSVLDCSSAEATKLKLGLTASKKLSVSSAAEIINYISNFYEFTAFSANSTIPNPFNVIHIQGKHYYQDHISPISESTLDALCTSYREMPLHCQLAFLIILETGVRSNEACRITVDELELGDSEHPILNIILKKNNQAKLSNGSLPIVRHSISSQLGNLLKRYVESTQELRNALKSNLVFVYMPETYREGSNHLPLELKTFTLTYWLHRICRTPNCTPRHIRAEIGRELFQADFSPSAVANMLGNTSSIATKHYNAMTPSYEAALYSQFYNTTLKVLSEHETSEVLSGSHFELYGTCNSSESCKNKNRCEACSQLVTCRDTKKGCEKT